jgi:adenylosuccinate synthase
MPQAEGARLREAGGEYGATTGRPRRCGWLDLPALRYAARVNGLTRLVVTKLDVLDAFDELKIAVGYECEGKPVRGFPSSARVLERCTPVWKSFPGWKSATTGVRRWADLPAAARAYLEWIESEVGVRIVTVSVGAERESEVTRS